MVLFPFSTSAPISQKIATAAVVLVIGFAIGSLLNGVGSRAVRQRRVPPRGGYDEHSQDTYAGPGQARAVTTRAGTTRASGVRPGEPDRGPGPGRAARSRRAARTPVNVTS